MVFSLSPNLLRCLGLTRESFAIIGGRLYTLHLNRKNRKTKNFLHSSSTYFPLEESEKLCNLENEYYEDNGAVIEKQMSNIIFQNYISKINQSSSAIKSLEKILSQTSNQRNIAQFIAIDVVNAYKRISHETRSKITSNRFKFNTISNLTDIQKYKAETPAIDELISNKTCLDVLKKGKNLLSMGGKVYELVKSNRTNHDEFLEFSGNKYSIVFWKNLSELEKEYSRTIDKRIYDKAMHYGNKYSSVLSECCAREDNLKRQSKQINISKKEVEVKSGRIGYNRLSDSIYRIYIELDPYLILKNKRYYKFDSLKLGTDLIVGSNTLSIAAPCEVLQKEYYSHPFVKRSDNNKICYAGEKIWARLGVKYNHKYNLKDSNLARIVGNVLYAASQIITTGYTLKSIVPINNISNYTPLPIGSPEIRKYTYHDNDNIKQFIRR